MGKYLNKTKVKVKGYGPIKIKWLKDAPNFVTLVVKEDEVTEAAITLNKQELTNLIVALEEAEYAIERAEDE